MAITWKFVDSPVSTPAVLLDMNDKLDFALNMGKDFDVSPPTLRKSSSTNSMADGARLTAASFDNRFLKFTVAIDPMGAKTVQQKELLLTELNMELAKPENLIMYKPDVNSQPVFFQTVRSDAYVLDHRGGSKKSWDVACEVEAQPFAIGIRQSPVVNVTITNDPASGTNPQKLDITGIKGDVPAPAFIRMGTSFGALGQWVFAQKTDNATALGTVFVQAESGTQGTDTTTQANDTSYSGAGNNFSRTTFATNANLTTRLTLTIPQTIRGTYRVYARLRTGTGTNNYTIQAAYPGTDRFFGPALDIESSAQNFGLYDLGLMDFPFPSPVPPQFGYSRLTGTSYPSQNIEILAARSSGTGNLDFDYIYFMPADERMCQFSNTSGVGFIVIDGAQEKAYGMTSASDPFGATRIPDSQGGVVVLYSVPPQLVPGVTNRWFMLRGGTSAVTNTWALWVDYWPQWRVVATP